MKKRNMKILGILLASVMLMLTAACGNSNKANNTTAQETTTKVNEAGTDTPAPADKKITLGFSQVGAESGWRSANTKSIQSSAKEAGYELKFSDAQQKQENQIKAIRSYIQQKVDVIAFSPVVESGWDTVLKEAKDAGIPVILTDRAVDSKDTSLYKTFIGSDFVEEGKRQANGLWTNIKMQQKLSIL